MLLGASIGVRMGREQGRREEQIAQRALECARALKSPRFIVLVYEDMQNAQDGEMIQVRSFQSNANSMDLLAALEYHKDTVLRSMRGNPPA